MPETLSRVTVAGALRDTAARLRDAGCDSPRLDAELLLADVLGVTRSRLVVDAAEPLAPSQLERFEALVSRRAAREPVAYILGRKEFRRITLRLDPRVLIPRPETELLVEVGLSLPAAVRVVDVGTGSGAVALALKDERPDLDVAGTDISDAAVAVARANAAQLDLDVRFVVGDLLAGVACDAVLANLPYVAAGSSLPPEIASYEPAAALFAGADGLGAIRRLVMALPPSVTFVALEVGAERSALSDPTIADQAAAVATLLRRTGFRSIKVLRDLAGHERVVVGRR